MSIMAIIKIDERKRNDEALAVFLAKGGAIIKSPPLTYEILEEQWRNQIPPAVKARLARQSKKAEAK